MNRLSVKGTSVSDQNAVRETRFTFPPETAKIQTKYTERKPISRQLARDNKEIIERRKQSEPYYPLPCTSDAGYKLGGPADYVSYDGSESLGKSRWLVYTGQNKREEKERTYYRLNAYIPILKF